MSGLVSMAMALIFGSAMTHCCIGRALLWKRCAFDEIHGKAKLDTIARSQFFKPLKADYLMATFNIQYDQSAYWNWSTHEHFTFVRVNYESSDGMKNVVTVWDDIALDPLVSKMDKVVRNEYPVMHYNRGIRGTILYPEICFQYMPWAGFYETHCHPFDPEEVKINAPKEYFDETTE